MDVEIFASDKGLAKIESSGPFLTSGLFSISKERSQKVILCLPILSITLFFARLLLPFPNAGLNLFHSILFHGEGVFFKGFI